MIAVEDNPVVLEGTWPSGRTVIIKFPNDLELRKWYDYKEYQSLAIHQAEDSVASIMIITGRDD